jgi:ABC-type cobalamin transport system permease subunit
MPKRVLWILMILGGAMALAGIFMRRSMDPAIYAKAGIVGWSGIGIALIARILLGIRQRTGTQTKKLQ